MNGTIGRKWWILVALTVCMASGVASARRLVWMGSQSDKWNVASKWYVQSPWTQSDTCPAADDYIVVAIDHPLRLDVTDADNLAVLNGCAGVCLPEGTSKFTINAPQDSDTTISVPICGGYEPTSGSSSKGQLYFMGNGTVHLTATNLCNYYMKEMYLDGTTVWLSQAPDLVLRAYMLGTIAISNNATLYLPTCHNGGLNVGANYVMMQKLFGDGTMTATETAELRFGGSGGVFEGVLGANVKLFSGGRQYLTGTNSLMSNYPNVFNAYSQWATGAGVLGVKKIGMKNEPSSLGVGATINVNVRGGTYLYLGEGEESDKVFNAYAAGDGISVLDGGTHGGLVFVGTGGILNQNSSTRAYNCLVGLSGSGAEPCVIQGRVNDSSDEYLSSIVKKGAGTWRFVDPVPFGYNTLPNLRSIRGTISVDEGVFQFDTIAPPGEYCSIGRSSVLKPPVFGKWADLPDVDWAFSLGGTNSTLNALAEGTLEYIGTKAALADRRKVRLEANGRLRANAPKKIRYRMSAPTSARAKTLSLDGSSLATNEVHDVTDTAEYPVSVVKEGEGTWLLGGDQSFHGDLTVKGGRLLVRRFDAGSNYTWFRFTVKNMFEPVGGSKDNVTIRFIGFYDADGYCQNANLRESEDGLASSLEPGEVGYGTTRAHTRGVYSAKDWNNDNITNVFCWKNGTMYDAKLKKVDGSNYGYPRLEDELTWLPLVARLTNGAPAIASYDWSHGYGWTTGDKAGFRWTPNRWSLEGSVDGIHWENVKADGGDYVITTNDCPAVAKSGYFIFSGLGYAYESTTTTPSGSRPLRHSGGRAIRGTSTNTYAVLTNVRSVQVDHGATLEMEGTNPTFTDVTVDASKGGGVIRGATFGATGTLRLVNYVNDGTAKALPFDLSGTTGAEGLKDWTLVMNGTAAPRWHARYANGALTVMPPGLRLHLR